VLVPTIGLVKDGFAGRQSHGAWISKAAHAAQGPEVVIERSVLLHHEHDMPDISDRSGLVVRRDRERLGDAVLECGAKSACGQ
jgi:hypothetical protein